MKSETREWIDDILLAALLMIFTIMAFYPYCVIVG